jgi:hypothetical protein
MIGRGMMPTTETQRARRGQGKIRKEKAEGRIAKARMEEGGSWNDPNAGGNALPLPVFQQHDPQGDPLVGVHL